MHDSRRKQLAWRHLGALALVASVLVIGAPEAVAANEVHLTAAGDYGARAATGTVLQKVAELAPDAHLALGDLAYGDAVPESAWCAFVKARVGEGFPFQLISGNHESLDQADGAINNYSACLPNQIPGVTGTYGREYTMDFPKDAPLVRVIQTSAGLNFEDGRWNYNQGDAHYTWLSNAIDAGRAKGAKWIVVTTHYPCQSVSVNNCPATDFYRLMIAKKVDLVLHGHEHAYMRTHQLRAGFPACPTIPSGTFDADCVADSDSTFTAQQGTVFATVGTGGTPLRDVNPADSEAGYFATYSGLNSNPTYGLLDLRFTDTQIIAGFVPTSGGNFTDAFTITTGGPPVNMAPISSFTTQVQDLTVTVNGSGSSDPDGTISSYSWDFGDGTGATGATPATRAYAAAGTYQITLTVTDNQGSTSSSTRPVTVIDPSPITTLAQDLFTRSVASGWGSAPTGGAWTVSTPTASTVNGASGVITSTIGAGRTAYLRSVSSTTTDMVMSLASDKLNTGGGLTVSAVGRSIGGAGDYRSVVRFRSDGRMAVRLSRAPASGAEVTIAPDIIVPGVTYTAADKILVRVQVTGTAPTTIRTKVWRAGTTEPTAWILSVTDSTANLQAAGNPGLVTYLSTTATNAPIALSVDDLLVTRP